MSSGLRQGSPEPVIPMIHARLPRPCYLGFGGVLLLAVGELLGPVVEQALAKKGPLPPRRFLFKIDPKTPLAELLPPPPEPVKALLPWQVQELSEVPEIQFQKVVAP